MAININVTAICPDKQVEIERVEITKAEELAFEYAMCSKEKDGKYKIVLNMAKIKELWENSWLYDYVTDRKSDV